MTITAEHPRRLFQSELSSSPGANTIAVIATKIWPPYNPIWTRMLKDPLNFYGIISTVYVSASVAITPIPIPIKSIMKEREMYSCMRGLPRIPIDSIISPSRSVQSLPLVSPKIIEIREPIMHPANTEPLSIDSWK